MPAVSVRCLGPIGITQGSVFTPLSGAVDALVLALLTTDRAGVRVDELLERVWNSDDRSPMIQSIYRLRKRLGSKETIVQEGNRYRLDVPVDAWEFEDGVTGVVDGYEAALALCTGDPYDGLDETAVLHDAREHLRRLRIDALETLAGGAADNPVVLLPLVRAGALSEPWNERLTIAAMTAFVECEQPEVAIELASRCRLRLREDLDVDTSPRLDAHEAAIRQNLAIRVTPPRAHVRLSSRRRTGGPDFDVGTVLVEREAPIDRLERTVASAKTGPGRITLIEGAAGIGKSALSDHYARLRSATHTIRRGAGRSGDPVAFESILTALPELQSSLDHLRLNQDASVGRLLFARDAEQLLHNLTAASEMLLIIEDLHAVDAQSMTLLSYLAERALPAQLTMMLTTRVQPADSARLAELDWLSQRPIVDHVRLAPLSESGIRRMVDARHPGERGSHRARFADHVAAKSQGIPLVADALIRAAEPGLPIDQIGPSSDGTLLANPYRSMLSAEDSALLSLAALVGFTFDLATVAEISEKRGHEVAITIDRAVAAAIVLETEHDEEFQFGHQLTHDYFSSLPSSPLKRRVLAMLAVRPDARKTDVLRYIRGAGGEIPIGIALSRLSDAAEALRMNLAFAEAREVLLELERLLPTDDPRRVRTLTTLAECATRAGLPTEASRWRALALPLCNDDVEVAKLAVSGLPDGEFVGGEPDRLEMFDRVSSAENIEALSTAFYTRCHLRIARLAGDLPRVRQILHELSAERYPDDPEGWAELQFERLLIETAHDGKAVHDELRSLAGSLDPGPLQAAIRHRQLVAARVEQVEPVTDLHAEIAAEVRLNGSPLTRWGVGQIDIALNLEKHDINASAADRQSAIQRGDVMITRAHQAAVRHGVANADAGLAAQTFLQLWNAGRLGDAAPLIDAASTEGVPNPGWMAAAALAAASAGDLLRARVEANRVLDIFRTFDESNWRLNASAILVEAAWLAGLPDAAEAAAAELRSRSGRCIVLGVGSVSLGPVDRYLGKAAALTGAADPIPLLEAAIEQADRMEARLWADRARLDLAEIS